MLGDNAEEPGDDVDEEKTAAGQEVDRVVATTRKDPGQPSKEEIAKHNITHLPYRSWCSHCVRGRGTAHPHISKHDKGEHDIPIIGADYHYMGMEEEEGTIPMLVIKDGKTKVIFDIAVPAKGPQPYVITRVIQCLDQLGYQKIIMKSDQ